MWTVLPEGNIGRDWVIALGEVKQSTLHCLSLKGEFAGAAERTVEISQSLTVAFREHRPHLYEIEPYV